jgi:hypothetical protein
VHDHHEVGRRAIVRISESTVAKTGRSMKKWESRIEIRLSEAD